MLLQTLPGWPEVPDVPVFNTLFLLLLVPLGACLVIGALALMWEKLRPTYAEPVGELRDDMKGPSAEEVVRDASARQEALDRGEDPSPAGSRR